MTDAELIKALGGPTCVAKALHVSPQAAWNWGSRDTGIPAEYHIPLWKLAQTAAIDWVPPEASGLKLAPAQDAA